MHSASVQRDMEAISLRSWSCGSPGCLDSVAEVTSVVGSVVSDFDNAP